MLPLRPHGARIYIQNEKEKYWHTIRSYSQTSSKIQSHIIMAPFSFYFCPSPQLFVFSFFLFSLFLSPSRLHKEANKSTAGCAGEAFYEKIFIASRAKHTSSSLFGVPLEKPVCSTATRHRFFPFLQDITLQYCIILRSTSIFVCLDLTRLVRGTRRASLPGVVGSNYTRPSGHGSELRVGSDVGVRMHV